MPLTKYIIALLRENAIMSDIIAALKIYFETTPKDKISENWEKSESFDQIGPTMDEYLEYLKVTKH